MTPKKKKSIDPVNNDIAKSTSPMKLTPHSTTAIIVNNALKKLMLLPVSCIANKNENSR